MVLEYQSTEVAENGTTETNIEITGHNLTTTDFMVNTTRRATSQSLGERGSRRITRLDNNNFEVSQVVGQTQGDNIRLYKFVDRTEYLDNKGFSVTKRINGESTCNFQIAVNYDPDTEQIDYQVYEGQIVKVYVSLYHQITGVISGVSKKLISQVGNKILLSVSVIGLKTIAYRRIVKVSYDTTWSTDDIVSDLIYSFLKSDGISEGTISTGIALEEEMKNDCVSIGEIIDVCAEKSGYQWNIDNDFELNWYQDPVSISNAAHQLVDGNGFTDYRNIEISGTLDGYINKCFLVGGMDAGGNQVYNVYGSLSKQNAMQDITGGTGIYGTVNRDSSNVERTVYHAESGTTSTNLKATGHIFQVGDFFWNKTRKAYTFVTVVVDANNVTVESVSGQTTNDVIIFYHSANAINKNSLKRYGIINREISFETFEIDFEVGTKLNISLKKLGITSSYWNIEEVILNSIDLKYFRNTIRAVQRDNSNFSTQKKIDALDYFRRF
jgi:hypothetical protein